MRWGSRRGVAMLALAGSAIMGAAGVPVATAGGKAPARTAAQKFSERFDGRSGNASFVASVFIAAVPGQKSGFAIGFRQGRCSDGGPWSSLATPLRNQGFTHPPSGLVTFAGYYPHAYAFDRHGKLVHGHEHFHVQMQFAGTLVHGFVTDTFTSPRLRCQSGRVYFNAWRDGTAHAPLNTTWGSTGHYHGTSSYGDSVGMDVFLPLAEVTRLKVSFRAGLVCTGGLYTTGTEQVAFHNLLLNGTAFRFSGQSAYSKGGYRYVANYTILGGPLRDIRWIYVVKSYRAGRHIGTCRMRTPGGERFSLTPPRGRTV